MEHIDRCAALLLQAVLLANLSFEEYLIFSAIRLDELSEREASELASRGRAAASPDIKHDRICIKRRVEWVRQPRLPHEPVLIATLSACWWLVVRTRARWFDYALVAGPDAISLARRAQDVAGHSRSHGAGSALKRTEPMQPLSGFPSAPKARHRTTAFRSSGGHRSACRSLRHRAVERCDVGVQRFGGSLGNVGHGRNRRPSRRRGSRLTARPAHGDGSHMFTTPAGRLVVRHDDV